MREETNRQRPAAAAPRLPAAAVRSEDLFGGTRELIIRHGREEYRR